MSNDFYIPDDEQSYLQAQMEQDEQEWEILKEQENERTQETE